ncbi:MAG: hypothetical protein ACREP1_12580, partial [Rhodanobacteraceae bacterium]
DEHGGGLPSLLVAHLFDSHAERIELTLPADPADWASTSNVTEFAVAAVEELSAAYYRVTIAAGPEATPEVHTGNRASDVAASAR